MQLKKAFLLLPLFVSLAFAQWHPQKSNTDASLNGLSIVSGSVCGTNECPARAADPNDASRAAEPLTSGALRRRSGWLRSSMSSRQSFNIGSIIARVTSAHGFGRLCRAITNTMLCPVTPVSCASSGVAYADCGGAF